jgi:hypothetical protein
MPGGPIVPSLTIQVTCEDPVLIGIEARVIADDWAGLTWADIFLDSLREEACSLLNWAANPKDDCVVNFGFERHPGWFHLRFFASDRSGHMACQVELVSLSRQGQRNCERRLAVEFPTEPMLVERFARQLIRLAETCEGSARLDGIP